MEDESGFELQLGTVSLVILGKAWTQFTLHYLSITYSNKKC